MVFTINSFALNREYNLPRKFVFLELTFCSLRNRAGTSERQAEEGDSSEELGAFSRLLVVTS
jgi:hypothetical protein